MPTTPKTILTRTVTPGVQGTLLRSDKYHAVKRAILDILPRDDEGMPIRDLARAVRKQIPKDMLPEPGSATWLTMAVKLDLEARGSIRRIPGSRPQRLRRVR